MIRKKTPTLDSERDRCHSRVSELTLSLHIQDGGSFEGDNAATGGFRLHRQLSQTRSVNINWDLVREVMEQLSEKGELEAAVEDVVGSDQLTFLHMLCMYHAPLDLIQATVGSSSCVAKIKNAEGMLALHVACKFGASAEVVSVLVSAHRGSLHERDNQQRVPLHWLLEPNSASASRDVITSMLTPERHARMESPEIVKLLVTSDVVTLPDSEDLSPLDLFAQSCQRVSEDDMITRDRAHETFNLLLELDPTDSTSVFTSLRSFPEWLLEHALNNFHVQCILNEKAAHPVFSMFLMLDILFEVVLIVSFLLAAMEKTNASTGGYISTQVELTILYGGVAYFSARALMSLKGFIKIGRLDLWMTDFWQCCDLVHIGLLVACLFLRQSHSAVSVEFHWVFSVTGGVQWLHLISLLRATSISISVFVTFLVQMPRHLLPFLVTTLLLLGSFAFMYFSSNISSKTCIATREGYSHSSDISFCSAKSSLLRVFTMFVGVVEDDFFTSSASNLVLSVLFSFSMIILQLNVLIAVITDVYGSVRDNCEAVFWHQRFYYLYSLESVKRTLQSTEIASQGVLRELWHASVNTVHSGRSAADNLEQRNTWSLQQLILRAVSLVFIPVWLAAGLATLGWMWPPQVRFYLFCLPLSKDKRTNHSENISRELRQKCDQSRLANDLDEEKEKFCVKEKRLEQLASKVDTMQKEWGDKFDAHDAKLDELRRKTDKIHEVLQHLVAKELIEAKPRKISGLYTDRASVKRLLKKWTNSSRDKVLE